MNGFIFLASIYLPVILCAVALTAFLPWHWLKRLLFAIGLLVLTAYRLTPSDNDGHFVYGLIMLQLTTVALILGAALALRYTVERRRRRDSPSRVPGPVARLTDVLLAIAAGCVLALYIFAALGWAWESQPHGYRRHGIVFLLGLALAAAAYRFRGKSLATLTLGFGLAIAALSAWGALLFPSAVLTSATELAAGRPFCIGLGNRQRPPESFEDLTFLTMDKSPVGHAALLVGDGARIKAAHWSYQARAFERLDPGSRAYATGNAPCAIGKAAFVNSGDDRGFTLLPDGPVLRIPAAYRPRLSQNYLTFHSTAPDFGPAPEGTFRTSVAFGNAGWLESERGQTEKAGVSAGPYGLMRRKDGPFVFRADDRMTTIACGFGPERDCIHRFNRNGNLYDFRHPTSLLPRWQEIEDRLVALVESFIQTPAAPRPR